jgi:hypothetical protein
MEPLVNKKYFKFIVENGALAIEDEVKNAIIVENYTNDCTHEARRNNGKPEYLFVPQH